MLPGIKTVWSSHGMISSEIWAWEAELETSPCLPFINNHKTNLAEKNKNRAGLKSLLWETRQVWSPTSHDMLTVLSELHLKALLWMYRIHSHSVREHDPCIQLFFPLLEDTITFYEAWDGCLIHSKLACFLPSWCLCVIYWFGATGLLGLDFCIVVFFIHFTCKNLCFVLQI